MADARMKTLNMPFDGQRMIFGGFSPIVEKGSAKGTSYADGFVVPAPAANRDAYIRMASNAASVFEEYGALRVVEGWGDDVPNGKVPISGARSMRRTTRRFRLSWSITTIYSNHASAPRSENISELVFRVRD